MAEEFLKRENGFLRSKEAIVESTGSDDSGKIHSLNSDGKISDSLLQYPSTQANSQNKSVMCKGYESFSGGNWVNIYYQAGELRCRKATADGANPYPADGYVRQAQTYDTTALDVEVFVYGINDQWSGLLPGDLYYLSTTDGSMVTTPPSGTGEIKQKLGKAISETEIIFEKQEHITLA